jgi:hypothetical protein
VSLQVEDGDGYPDIKAHFRQSDLNVTIGTTYVVLTGAMITLGPVLRDLMAFRNGWAACMGSSRESGKGLDSVLRPDRRPRSTDAVREAPSSAR